MSLAQKHKLTLKTSKNPTFIEVCAGCGGLSQGFIEAGFIPLVLNEIDTICCSTLTLNHPQIPVTELSLILRSQNQMRKTIEKNQSRELIF